MRQSALSKAEPGDPRRCGSLQPGPRASAAGPGALPAAAPSAKRCKIPMQSGTCCPTRGRPGACVRRGNNPMHQGSASGRRGCHRPGPMWSAARHADFAGPSGQPQAQQPASTPRRSDRGTNLIHRDRRRRSRGPVGHVAQQKRSHANERKGPQMNANGPGETEAAWLSTLGPGCWARLLHAGRWPICVHLRKFAFICVPFLAPGQPRHAAACVHGAARPSRSRRRQRGPRHKPGCANPRLVQD